MELPIIVTMIHGTFANRAAWTNDEKSLVRERIGAQLGDQVIFRPFNWSGANSHGARIRAGAELAADQVAVAKLHPGSQRFLLAHSHGGNVAYYAMHSMPPDARPLGIITMGTPYIHCQPRDIASMRVLGPWILAFISVLVFPFAIALLLFLSSILEYFLGRFVIPEGVFIVGFLILAANLLRIPIWAYNKYPAVERWAFNKQSAILDRITLRPSDVPCMYIHVAGDEAGGWLRLLDYFSNIPAKLWHRATVVLVSGAAAVWLCTEIYLGRFEYQSLGGAFLLAILGSAIFVFGAVIAAAFNSQVLMILVPFVTRSHRAGFGGEGLWSNWLARITAEPFPPLRENSVAYEKKCDVPLFKLRVFRHSWMYSDSDVLDSIAKWIRSTTHRTAE